MVVLVAFGSCFLPIFVPSYWLYISSCILLFLKNAILVIAILKLKTFIKRFGKVERKDWLINMHYTNVFLYTLLYYISTVYYVEFERRGNPNVYWWFALFIAISGVFQIYNVIFIYFLLLK